LDDRVFAGVPGVQDYVLSPWLLSSGVELHPLLVLFGVLVGETVAGILGCSVGAGDGEYAGGVPPSAMRWLVWLLAAVPAAGHMVSLSSGQMEISGTTAQLVLRVPADEAPEGEKTLGDAYRIAGATLSERTCRTENEGAGLH
jgi:hypothetical protein